VTNKLIKFFLKGKNVFDFDVKGELVGSKGFSIRPIVGKR
jgi:hypothetical protein